jgi:hypothetical protein
MFECLTIRQRSSASIGKPMDLGVLAEALIFYDEVRLIANRSILQALLTTATPEVLLELLEGGFLSLAYEADDVAIQTEKTGTPYEVHEPIYYSMPHTELPELLPKLLESIYGKRGKARRVANRLAKKIEIIRHSNSLTDEARQELSDLRYVRASVEALMRNYVPEYQGPIEFLVHREGPKLIVSTNIRFDEANCIYHQRIPATHSSLTPAYLLAHLLSVKADLHFAARFNSEIAIDDVNALIIRHHFGQLFQRLQPSHEAIASFQEFVFDDSRALAEAVRSGAHHLRELLPILPKAERFKKWLQTESAKQDVVRAYFREALERTWVEKLPAKSVRWFLFTAVGAGLDALGAGGLGTAAGIGLGAVDTFVLDRILQGWKPNQFVDDHLRKLVAAKHS